MQSQLSYGNYWLLKRAAVQTLYTIPDTMVMYVTPKGRFGPHAQIPNQTVCLAGFKLSKAGLVELEKDMPNKPI